MSRHHVYRSVLALGAAVGTALAMAAAPAQAADYEVVADGLDSPRHLTMTSDGALYVAEAGRGGSGPCVAHPELGTFCYGNTGAITRVRTSGPDRTVVSGLPSIMSNTGEALGPFDIVFTGGDKYVVSIGLGGSDTFREGFGNRGKWLGTLLTGRLGGDRPDLWADILEFEADENPDGADIDSNPTGLWRSGENIYLTDSGGNSVLKVDGEGDVSTVAVLEPVATTVPVDLEGGNVIPAGFEADAVPTAVVRGPDGAWYISQLTGFPFEKGLSSIWRLKPGGNLTEWATGLTNVTDLAFSDEGDLYAVEISSEGLLAGAEGSLVKVQRHSDTHEVVASGLVAPYGVALTDRWAYVTTCSVCTGGGQVVRIPLK
jgi:hypothetical protein